MTQRSFPKTLLWCTGCHKPVLQRDTKRTMHGRKCLRCQSYIEERYNRQNVRFQDIERIEVNA
jgi:recombinational DNA repair protein (RecF pathway)